MDVSIVFGDQNQARIVRSTLENPSGGWRKPLHVLLTNISGDAVNPGGGGGGDGAINDGVDSNLKATVKDYAGANPLTVVLVNVSGDAYNANQVDSRRGLGVIPIGIDASASGDNTVVNAVSGRKIKVLNYTVVVPSTVTLRWKSGAGGILSGPMSFGANGGVAAAYAAPGDGWLIETTGDQALVLNLSAGVAVGGHLVYAAEA